MLGKTPLSRTLASIFTVALLALALFAPTQVSARRQTQGPGSKSITQLENGPQVVNLPDRSKRYAVVIGIDKYTSDTNITPLRGAANDARAIAAALEKYAGFEHVILLTSDHPEPTSQPTNNIIWKTLANLKKYVDEDSMLVVAFSGHGVERKSDHQVFLLPQDALADPDYFERSAISVNQVKSFIKQTKATQVMLLLDSCRNDPTAGKGAEDNKLTKSYIDQFSMKNSGIKAFVTFYAAEEGQRAWEYQEKKQGYFSWAFVEGLKGAAKDPESGEITLGRLIDHMQTEVPRLAKFDGKVQKPHVEMDGYGVGLVLAKVEPSIRKAAPAPPAVALPPMLAAGAISVASEPGALITVEPLFGDKSQAKQATVPQSGALVFTSEQLKFGRYRITATREGFVGDSREEDLTPGKTNPIVLRLKEVTYTLTLKANVLSGNVRIGAKGKPAFPYTLQDGRVVAAGLSRGEYKVEITPDDASFKATSEWVTVGEDLERTFTLTRILREQPLDADFSLSGQWRLPQGWRATPALEVNGEGRAMLRDEAGRFGDFELSANVELLNGKSVSFIVRAVDEQNYYLVRLSGPRADTPNMLRLYVVKNGQEPRSLLDQSLRIFKLADQFVFTIKVTGGKFRFFIDDNSFDYYNKPIGPASAGEYTDGTFAAGSVGIAADPGDKAKIYQYLVCPGGCAKN